MGRVSSMFVPEGVFKILRFSGLQVSVSFTTYSGLRVGCTNTSALFAYSYC